MSVETTMMAHDSASEANSLAYVFKKLLRQATFIEIVIVESVDSDAKTCVVKPLVTPVNAANEEIDSQSVSGIPYFRLQMGSSAIIINPQAGDMGLMLVCDEDISNVLSGKAAATAATGQRHSRQFGVYLGGIGLLNGDPTEYIEFTGSGINIVAPNGLKIDGTVTTTSTITAEGEVTGNGIALSSHVHGGVESGGSETDKPE
ncbi:phage P2 baseplate assembly protein gpV [Serratia sp. M24T3]|uniref:phage P2 baseplate assembly protein gpV n=1 Tax=Serratia sp. M24T3 TaxID=932213 RepID=UPI00025B8F33|nr:phage P2 baseplate assembly protein gpV [Serratia sp. M24T3]EIC83977.1 phage P2 baseplate assembly protein gpV [Serratia sp. M24T3]